MKILLDDLSEKLIDKPMEVEGESLQGPECGKITQLYTRNITLCSTEARESWAGWRRS